MFCIDNIEANQLVGLVALNLGKPKYKSAEVWYKIHLTHWRKGFATEALRRVLTLGFKELNLHRIEAGCAVENIASARVLEKVVMKKEGVERKKLPFRKQWKDRYSYAILEEDFFDVPFRIISF